ncbi:zinc metalloprotease HtpX [Streptococcus pluranimalium]|uniref:zinc metalloprotease HtpX n=1 Tax=Streptococcus pluranimalium TaxID=82348 RepID=UPI001C4CBDDF|nr:zinc metalloprotease HtpX [Streptococcus pluranimalium]HEM6116069.1 zinc metalloprotease HtpX [Streptococcus suis]
MIKHQIASNKRRTIFLLVFFFILLAVIGAAIGYLMLDNMRLGLSIALIVGIIYAVSMIFQSTQVVMSMNGAREIGPEQAPEYYDIVEKIAMVAQIPMPKVYIIEDNALNAFATGSSPENAAVAATSGLLKVMNRTELEAVIGHEVSHIRNYDIRISTIAVALASIITLISSLGGRMMWFSSGRRRNDREEGSNIVILLLSLVTIILAPLVASLVQLAISRQREFLADASSVDLTKNPQAMINALKKLQASQPMTHPVDDASAALYISDPRNRASVRALFQTHPPLEARIKRLEELPASHLL